jgi:hypothetical protein
MMRFWAFAVTTMLLGSAAAFAQAPAPNSTKLCPITHNCRPLGQSAPQRHPSAVSPLVGAIQCPPGTYQLPNTNKCRVKK